MTRTASAATRSDPLAIERSPLDARLAVGAAAAWCAVVWGLTRSPGALLVASAIAVLLALAALRLDRARARDGADSTNGVRVGRTLAGLAMASFCVALVLLPLAARLDRAAAGSLHQLALRRAAASVDAEVTADPVTLAAKGVAGAPRVAVALSATAVESGGRVTAASGDVLVLDDARAWHDVLPGQRVRIAGQLAPDLAGDVTSVTLFAHGPPSLLGRPPWWQRLAGVVRASLRDSAAVLPAQERGLLPGLIDGDTSGLDPVLANRFQLAGLTHLVAVSGTNCSILLGAVLLVLKRARARPWVCAVLGALVLVLFVIVARPSPSVLRAALMAAIVLVSLASGRPAAGLPTLSAVVLGLVVWDPSLARSASFAMSALATAALLVIAPGWARWLRARHVPVGVAESVAVAAAAHLVTAPVIAAISGRVSLVAVPANVLAEPVVAVTTVVGFGAAVVGPVLPLGGTVLAWLAGWPCRWLVAVADFFGGIHGATLPWPGGVTGALALAAVLLMLALLASRAGARRVVIAVAATGLAIAIPVRSATSQWPPPAWLFATCDVGQGDALVLNAAPGAAVEIDAGPDPVPIDRCLRDLGVTRIPLLVLTHFHLDHVGGLPGAVRGRQVGQMLAGPLDEPYGGGLIVDQIASELHLTVHTPAVGSHLTVGAVALDVLGPAVAFHGTRSDPNNSSLILRATVHGERIMLPGDAEIEEQQALLASGQDLRVDVLKVPHHGSAYSEPAFLAAVHAKVAVVSVGLNNDYGHPSPVLLNEMAGLGVPLFRTDHDGDVAVAVVDGRLSAVERGVAASAVGLTVSPRPVRVVAPGGSSSVRAIMGVTVSGAGDRIGRCRPVRSRSTTCPLRCPESSWSSGTRTCSSTGPSARSPPRYAAPTPRWPKPTWPARSSRDRSCTRC